jgi:hypothetical protein
MREDLTQNDPVLGEAVSSVLSYSPDLAIEANHFRQDQRQDQGDDGQNRPDSILLRKHVESHPDEREPEDVPHFSLSFGRQRL